MSAQSNIEAQPEYLECRWLFFTCYFEIVDVSQCQSPAFVENARQISYRHSPFLGLWTVYVLYTYQIRSSEQVCLIFLPTRKGGGVPACIKL